MAFTDEEREQIRYHLGYLQVEPAGSLSFGIPRPIETMYLVETSMDNILAVAENRVRRIVQVLDKIECRLIDSIDRLAATSLDGLTLRDDEQDRLEREYWRWAGRMADILGVPFYPYANRFRAEGRGSRAGNIPVRG